MLLTSGQRYLMPILLKPQRLTPYSTAMDTSRLKVWKLLLILPFFMGCPIGEDRCFEDFTRVVKIDDLVSLTPIKDTFNRGEIITFALAIPDSVYFHNDFISLIKKTEDQVPRLVSGDINLFKENNLSFDYGNQGDKENWFHLEYLPELKKFSLVINITLIRSGIYKIPVWIFETTFTGHEQCERYRVDSNIKGFEPGEFYEFVVIE